MNVAMVSGYCDLDFHCLTVALQLFSHRAPATAVVLKEVTEEICCTFHLQSKYLC